MKSLFFTILLFFEILNKKIGQFFYSIKMGFNYKLEIVINTIFSLIKRALMYNAHSQLS